MWLIISIQFYGYASIYFWNCYDNSNVPENTSDLLTTEEDQTWIWWMIDILYTSPKIIILGQNKNI